MTNNMIADERASADGSQGEGEDDMHMKETFVWLHQAAKGVEADCVEINDLAEMHSGAQGIALP